MITPKTSIYYLPGWCCLYAKIPYIASASRQQAEGIGQINQAVAQIDTVTQRSAATAEEAASSSQELTVMSERLDDVISTLMGVISGKKNKGSIASVMDMEAGSTGRPALSAGGSGKLI